MESLQTLLIFATLGGTLSSRYGSVNADGSLGKKARLDLSVLKQSDVQVIRLRGRLTLGQAVDSFRQALETAFENGDNRVLVNLAEVPMVDSSASSCALRTAVLY